jgi:hypothetical protein
MKKLTLATIGDGGLVEDFDRELRALCENIADPNVKTDAVRTITVTLKVKPDAKGQTAGLSYSVKSSLPGADPGIQMAWIAMDEEKKNITLFHVDQRQEPLFKEPTVTEIKPIAGATPKVAEVPPVAAVAPPMNANN